MSTFLDTMRRLRIEARNTEIPETPNPMVSSSARELSEAQASQHIPPWSDEVAMPFELAKNEKLQGFDETEVKNLMRHLTESIFNFDLEVFEILERFASYNKTPLGSWNTIDACSKIIPGKAWYLLDDVSGLTGMHAPITAALRAILGIPRHMPFKIDPSYKSVPFSKVHVALIWSFVMDILLNKIDIYELPNMKTLRIMMSAIHSFADESKSCLTDRHCCTW